MIIVTLSVSLAICWQCAAAEHFETAPVAGDNELNNRLAEKVETEETLIKAIQRKNEVLTEEKKEENSEAKSEEEPPPTQSVAAPAPIGQNE